MPDIQNSEMNEIEEETGNTPLIASCKSKRRNILKIKTDLLHLQGNHHALAKELNAQKLKAECSYDGELAANLLQRGADAKLVNKMGETALTMSCEYGGEISFIVALIKKSNIDHARHDGLTALMLACKFNHIQAAECLLAQSKINIDRLSNTDKKNALMYACRFSEQFNVVNALLEKGADPTAGDCWAIWIAIKYARNEIALKLLASPKITSAQLSVARKDQTLLGFAAKNRMHEVVNRLCNLNVRDAMQNDTTALMQAVKIEDNAACIRLLCYHNQRVMEEQDEDDGNTALHLAIMYGLGLKECRYIIEKSTNKVVNKDGMNAFMLACKMGKESIAMAIIERSSNLNMEQVDDEGNTALMFACGNGLLQVVNKILEISDIELVNVTNNKGYRALMIACEKKQNLCALAILTIKNVDIESRAETSVCDVGESEEVAALDTTNVTPRMAMGENALMLACGCNDDEDDDGECDDMADVVRRLVRMRCELNICLDGMTALMMASERGNVEVVKALRTADHDVRRQSTQMTALRLAIKNRHVEVIKYLIKAEKSKNVHICDVEALDDKGMSDIMYATTLPRAKKMVQFIANHVRLDAADSKGKIVSTYISEQNAREAPTQVLKKTRKE